MGNAISGAENERLLLQTYRSDSLCPIKEKTQTTDKVSENILRVYHPILLKEYQPVAIVGDGNCLYRSISQAYSGHQDNHIQLRVLGTIEILLNRQYYDSAHRKYQDLVQDSRVVCSDYNALVTSAVTLGKYAEMLHMYAVSAALQTPVSSYYPPCVSSTFHTEPFTRKIIGRSVKNTKPVGPIMWTMTRMPTSNTFIPNHFVFLNKLCSKLTMTNEIDIDTSYDSDDFLTTRNDVDRDIDSDHDIDVDSDHDIDSNHDIDSDLDSKDSTSTSIDKLPEFNIRNTVWLNDSDIDKMNQDYDREKKTLETPANDSSIDSDKTTNDIGDSLPDNKFLDTETLVSLLTETTDFLDKIPKGKKDNRYFIIDNSDNDSKRDKKQKSTFPDDCGVWDTTSGSTPKTTYMKTDLGLKKVFVRNGVCCTEKMRNKKRHYDPILPPPTDIVELHRYYTTLKADKTYKKRVSWLGLGATHSLAVVEYLGNFPGLSAHGNAKTADEYVRTDDRLITKIGQMVKTMKPMDVYKELNRDCDELDGPTHVRQIRDKKRRDKIKEKQNNKQLMHNNIADHVLHIQNMLQNKHKFVRQVIHDNGKTPTIILYTDEQLTDIQRLCCTGQTVLGFDKTFNLCDMHVTASCFKQLTVDKVETGEPPLFIGPIFVHDSSDFETYSSFFSHLRIKLTGLGCDFKNLVIGTDDEKALKKSIVTVFPESTHVLCTRHLRQNTIDKLTTIGINKKDRNDIINSIFGQDGLIDANDSITFELRSDDIENTLSTDSFKTYFSNRLKPLLLEKINRPMRLGHIDKQWTNNNCESINHVLKQTIDWKSRPLLDFIELTHSIVTNQYKDLRRALVGLGQYRLADSHKHFRVDKMTWASKTCEQKDRIYTKFRTYTITDKDMVQSTDRSTQIKRPRTGGKKPGQRKRKRTERTVTI